MSSPAASPVSSPAPSPGDSAAPLDGGWARFGLRHLLALMFLSSAQFALMRGLGAPLGLGVGILVCFVGIVTVLVLAALLGLRRDAAAGPPAPTLPAGRLATAPSAAADAGLADAGAGQGVGEEEARGIQGRPLAARRLDQVAVLLILALTLLLLGGVAGGGWSLARQASQWRRVVQDVEERYGFRGRGVRCLGPEQWVPGLEVTQVTAAGAFDRAGIRAGDVIVLSESSERQLYRALAHAGDSQPQADRSAVVLMVAIQPGGKPLPFCRQREVCFSPGVSGRPARPPEANAPRAAGRD